MPFELLLARWTKRAARLVHREVKRHPVNADVQKRANHRAENEGESPEKKMVAGERVLHAYSLNAFCALRCMSHAIQMQLS